MDDPPRIRVWRLADGREITGTVKCEVPGDPRDNERYAIMVREFLDELGEVGYAFPEGRGALAEVLGTMSD